MDIAELGLKIRSDGVVVADDRVKKFTKSSERLDKSMGVLGRTVNSSVGAFRTFALQLVATAGAGLAMHKMIGSAMGLSSALAEVSTLLPTVGKNLQDVEGAAHQMAQTFGTTATEQVNAFYQVFSAGAQSVTEATKTLNAANKLAVGGVTDIKTAADGLTSVLNAYGSKVGDVTDVSDAMFVAMRAGKTTIGELSSSLGKVAPIAATLGVSFDELLSSIAALTKGGINTTEAVTGVRAILAAVAKPTAEATALANQLGLGFSSAALQAQGFAGFLDMVVEKTGGNNAALAQLFGGVEALVPVMALAGQAGQDFNEILDQMVSKSGATDEAFLRIAQSAEFKARAAFSRLADAGVQIGASMLQAAVPAIERLADTISDPQFIAALAAWGAGIIKFIDAIAQVAGGALKALQDLWGFVKNTPGFKNAIAVTADLDVRSLEVMRKQLAEKEPLLSGDRWLWNREGLEKEVADLKAAIAARLDPSQFDVGGTFGLLGNEQQAVFGSMDEALAALRGERSRTASAPSLGADINIEEILAGMTKGAKAANDNVIDLTEGIKDLKVETFDFGAATKNAFSGMGQGIIDAFRRGGDVGGSVLDMLMNKSLDLLGVLANQLFSGLMGGQGLSGLFGGSPAGFTPATGNIIGGLFAKGAAFDNGNVTAFASGGVVSSPTMFPMANGMGLMGEAGPEAIMPLKRGPDGSLGVRAANGNSMSVVLIELSEGLEGSILQKSGAQTLQIVQSAAPVIAQQGSQMAGAALAKGDYDAGMANYGVQRQAKER